MPFYSLLNPLIRFIVDCVAQKLNLVCPHYNWMEIMRQSFISLTSWYFDYYKNTYISSAIFFLYMLLKCLVYKVLRIEMQVLMDYYDEDINILTAIVANLSKVNRNYSIISSWWERFKHMRRRGQLSTFPFFTHCTK